MGKKKLKFKTFVMFKIQLNRFISIIIINENLNKCVALATLNA